MKKNKIAVILATLILLCFGLCACSGGDKEINIGRSDKKFKLICYATPFHEGIGDPPYGEHPEQNTDEHWQNIADCGFNYAMPINDITHEQVISTLEQAQKKGIKVLIFDFLDTGIPALLKRCEGKTYEQTMEIIVASEKEIIARYNQYAEYDSFAGISAQDEPAATFNNAISAAQDWWYEHYPQFQFHVNLLPSYGSYSQLFGATADKGLTFPDYVKQFVETTNPEYISYDYYPFIRSGMTAVVKSTYLYDLEVYATAAKKYDIPFLTFQQCTSFVDWIGIETYREYAWQIYTALAYGCEGFQTFKYWAYMSDANNSLNLGDGLVDPDGNKKPLYYAVQQVNKELRSFEDIYFNFNWEGTMPVGKFVNGASSVLNNPMTSLYGVSEVTSSGDAIIGQFKDKSGNKAYMAVNYTSPYDNASNTITMKFKTANKVLICKKGRQIVQKLDKHTLTMEIGSGEGYFIVPII